MEKFKHIMVDIETMGNRSYSSIVSIGAVRFDMISGECDPNTFLVNVSLKSCLDYGLIVNADTILWWMKQNDQARKDFMIDPIPLPSALLQFGDFCKVVDECEMWGNGARFDLGLLNDAYEKCNLPIPWNFRNERDVRTLVSLSPDIKKNHIYTGTAHNALYDCYNQIEYCSKTWNKLNR